MKRFPAFLLILAMIVIATINCKAKSLLDKSIGEEGKDDPSCLPNFAYVDHSNHRIYPTQYCERICCSHWCSSSNDVHYLDNRLRGWAAMCLPKKRCKHDELATDFGLAQKIVDCDEGEFCSELTFMCEKSGGTILEALKAKPDLSTFLTAVGVGGLVDTLNSTGPLTVFVPNNEAFAKIPSKILWSYRNPESIDQFKAMVSRHIVPNIALGKDNYYGLVGEVADRDLGVELETIGGETVLAFKGDVIWPDHTKIKSLTGKAYVKNDMSRWCVKNGCIYIIDNVL